MTREDRDKYRIFLLFNSFKIDIEPVLVLYNIREDLIRDQPDPRRINGENFNAIQVVELDLHSSI